MKKIITTIIGVGLFVLANAQENLAVDGTIYGSYNITDPHNSIDGNTSTSAVVNSSAWFGDLTIELDQVYNIGSIDIVKGGAPQETYRFMVSETSSSYYDYGAQGEAYLNNINRNAKYIKIEFEKQSGYANVIYEINVYENKPDIVFGYDGAGNRTSRTLVLGGTKSGYMEGWAPEPFNDLVGETSFAIYPNPTKGVLRVDIANLDPEASTSIRVFDLQGRKIYEGNALGPSNVVDISGQKAGTYVMVLQVGGKSQRWKIVKNE